MKKNLSKYLFVLLIVFSFVSFKSEAKNVSITLSLSEAEISDVLRMISAQSGINIIAGPEVSGKVTISFENVSLDDALSSILKSHGYDYIKEGNIIRVLNTGIKVAPTKTKVYTLKYIDASDIKTPLDGIISSFGKIQIVRRSKGVGSEQTAGRSNVIMVTDLMSNFKKIEEIMEKLDVAQKQVMIEAKIIEVSLTKGANLGINWNLQAGVTGGKVPTTLPLTNSATSNNLFPSGSTTSTDFTAGNLFPNALTTDFAFGILDFSSLSATLKLMKSKGDVNVLSNPKIATLDNQEAKIVVGDVIPIPTYTYNDERAKWEITGYDEEEVGITLTVTPHISPEGTITMKVIPEVSEITGWVVGPSGQNEKPLIATRKAETQVTVNDTDTIAIGGLIKDKETETINKVPLLGDIPILGWLFKHKQKSVEKIDLLVFITPYILTKEKIATQARAGQKRLEDLRNKGKKKKKKKKA